MCVLFQNLEIVLRCIIIVLFLFYIRLKSRSKELSSNTFITTSMIITYLPLYSLGSFLETRLSSNLPISTMLSVKLLTQEKKLELSFVTLVRHLTVLGLFLKLEAAGITGSLLTWFRSYLTNRKQRVVLPGVQSNWNYIRAGVPQG